MIQAVLFDLDGVIVNTIHYHYLAWEHMFSELGGSISEHSILLHEGRASREILPVLLEEAGVSIPESSYADFINRKREYYRSIVHVTEYPGVFDVIRALRERGLRTALVTASARKNLEKSLDPGKRALFDFLISGDEVHRAKPAPDPYLAAMNHLGLTPSDCLVVENAPLGIESAKNAGMRCIAIETTLDASYLQKADYIVHDVRELLVHPALASGTPTHE